MRLWLRLFIAIATLSVASLCGLLWWQQQAFARGFSSYLDGVALAHARDVSERLSRDYATRGSWQWLRDNPSRFGGIVEVKVSANAEAESPNQRSAPPHPPESNDLPRRPPREGFDGDRPPPPRDGREGKGPPPGGPDRGGPPSHRYDVGSRLSLFDAEGRYIAGSRLHSVLAQTVPVQVGDQRVGELRIAALPRPDGDLETAFARQQWRSGWIAGVIVLAAALASAFWLARRLLGPVHALAAGTRALAAGDYASRVAAVGRDELGALARDFNQLASTLEQHRGARQRWGADIAHELRTPLTVLRVELQTLIDGVRVADAAALTSLLSECERLSSLVDDLYQLSLADAGALEYRFARVDVGDVLAEAAQHLEHAVRGTGIVVAVDAAEGRIFARADRWRLAQVFANLLANSRRYTDAPGRIELRLAREDDLAVITLDDTPPGVAPEDLPRLFERLFRAEASRTRERGGAGLGLAICRAIVEAHGGRIQASASPLGGLRVRVELPLMKEDA